MGLFGDSMGRRGRHEGLWTVLVPAHHGQAEGEVGWKCLASADLFSPMLSSTFATILVVPTTFCTSDTSWSNSFQRQHIFPGRVAFQSGMALSAQAGTTLPWRVCIPLILHRPRCGGHSSGHWLGGHPVICSVGCTGPQRTILPLGFAPTLAFSVGGHSFWASDALS